MVDFGRCDALLLATVDEEPETEGDDDDDARSNSSTLKLSSSCRRPDGRAANTQNGSPVVMTESTDSGLESDKNVDSEATTSANGNARRRRTENLLYHCQVGLSTQLKYLAVSSFEPGDFKRVSELHNPLPFRSSFIVLRLEAKSFFC